MAGDLKQLRERIDAIDQDILKLVSERAAVAHAIGKLKTDGIVYRPEREAQVLRGLIERNPGPLPDRAVTRLFTEIISACRALEDAFSVAGLGPRGTFSEEAVVKHFGGQAPMVLCASIDEVFRSVESSTVGYGVVPVENSTEGAVGRTMDLLVSSSLRICGEVLLPVHQNLMSRAASGERIKRVYSHAQSLAQCNRWLIQNHPELDRVPVSSNAEAARLASEDEGSAAIAGRSAAELYGLNILAASIEDEPNNTTRFVVVSQQDAARSGRDKTSLVMASRNVPGAMHELLTPLARHNVSMSRLESRPSRTGLWEYVFFVDLEGHQTDGNVAQALAEMRDIAAFLKVLGSYPVAVFLSSVAARDVLDVCDRAPGYVRGIAPYQPGKPISELARELGLREDGIIKLASNENPLGASPKAIVAMQAALSEVGRYPDGNGFQLKAALSDKYGVSQDRVVLGNGSNDILEMAARAFLAPGASAVYSQHAFAVYPLATQATGAEGIEVRAREFGHDLEAMATAIRGDTRVVFIANPNNPTGTWIAPGALLAFLRKVPADVLVVLDEAYNEYLEPAHRGDSARWLDEFPNLVISRTFSKAYGLAGLRVGYALVRPQIADLMNRVRQPFNVSHIAQVAAVAALADQEFVQKSYALNRDGMQALTDGFRRLGLSWIPSHANFVSFRVGDGAGVFQRLLTQGVIVRPIGAYGMPEHLRVTIGTPAENQRFLAVLEAVLAGHR